MERKKFSPAPASTTDLVDTVAANESFKTFSRAVEQAGLVEQLRGEGPYTIFAPTDAAFAKLPAGKLDELFKPENKAALASLLNYHMLKGHKLVADIGKWDSARTLHGQMTRISVSGKQVSIDDALVTSPDISSSNGVLHGIDHVNEPA